MIATLLSHGWKKLSRSGSFDKEIITSIFLGLFTIILTCCVLILGFALESIISKTLGQADSIYFLNGLLLYYFVFEFMLRYFMQNLPVLEVEPYLHLPIKRSYLVHFLLGRSVGHFLNSFVFLLFTPFAFTTVATKHGFTIALSWLLVIWLISLSTHFLVMLFKKKLDDTIWGLLVLGGLFSFFGAADYFGWFKLSTVSSQLFEQATHGFYLLGISIFIVVIFYWFNFRFFISSLYPEEISGQKESTNPNRYGLSFLQNFGFVGELINLEVKLILRNKRPRTILFLSILLLLYGLLFYTKPTLNHGYGFLLFIGVFITGAFSINYGQFLFSWQGGHFDFTNTQPFSLRQYLESKYWLLSGVIFICFLLSIPYVYFGWHIVIVNAIMMIFNVGVNTHIIMNMGMWDPKKIDLAKRAAFNWEGVGAAQWLMSVPLLLSPYAIYLPFSLSGYPNIGLAALAIVGIAGIVLHPYLLSLTAKRLLNKKYIIAAGFRRE